MSNHPASRAPRTEPGLETALAALGPLTTALAALFSLGPCRELGASRSDDATAVTVRVTVVVDPAAALGA
jgi:hypothetical protein